MTSNEVPEKEEGLIKVLLEIMGQREKTDRIRSLVLTLCIIGWLLTVIAFVWYEQKVVPLEIVAKEEELRVE